MNRRVIGRWQPCTRHGATPLPWLQAPGLGAASFSGACALLVACLPLGDLDAYSSGRREAGDDAGIGSPMRSRDGVQTPAVGQDAGAIARDDSLDASDGRALPAPTSESSVDVLVDAELASGATPAIVGTVPADGETGVRREIDLEIVFGQAMDRASVERSLSSDSLSLVGATFAWSSDDRVLRVALAQALEYAAGSDPNGLEALTYGFELVGAATRHGRQLPDARVSFRTLRRVSASVLPAADPALTGNWRSDGVYGTGRCVPGGLGVCVGDSSQGGESRYDGFLTFDLSGLPPSRVELSEMRLEMPVDQVFGDPFASLGTLDVEQVALSEIGPASVDATALDVVGAIAPTGVGEVAAAVMDAGAANVETNDAMVQYRLRFENATDGDGATDLVILGRTSARLAFTYLLP